MRQPRACLWRIGMFWIIIRTSDMPIYSLPWSVSRNKLSLYVLFSSVIFAEMNSLKIFNLSTVNGDWSSWGAWGTCSVTCGNGAETRVRKCSNPEPMYGGRPCQGHPTESRSCHPKYCSGMPSLEWILQHDVILVSFIIWMYKSSNSVAHLHKLETEDKVGTSPI